MQLRGKISSEVCLKGHPDHVCDQIADALLDREMLIDKKARAGIEVFLPGNKVFVGGEIKIDDPDGKFNKSFEEVVRETIKGIGYDSEEKGLDYKTCEIVNLLKVQSPDISMGVDTGGAGDNGFSVGYATSESYCYQPNLHKFIVDLAKSIDSTRDTIFETLNPDGKIIAVFSNVERDLVLENIAFCLQEGKGFNQEEMEKILRDLVETILPPYVAWGENKGVMLNPTGRFVLGGPAADCSVTSRKLVVNAYGPFAPIGGGGLAGKDPSKVDRTAAYYARYIAKNMVATGLFYNFNIQLSYVIGISNAVGFAISFFPKQEFRDVLTFKKVHDAIAVSFNMGVEGMIGELGLRNIRFSDYTLFPYFSEMAPWERTDKVGKIKDLLIG